jgi:signal transduction histidine kinase
MLYYYYREHINKHYDDHVLMHLEEIVTAADLTQDGQLALSANPSDPRFDVPYSGWYWEIRNNGQVLKSSPSLADEELNLDGVAASNGVQISEIIGPGNQLLRVQTLMIDTSQEGQKLLLAASTPTLGIKEEASEIAKYMLINFAVLGLGLMVAVAFQVRLALRPLNHISSGISEIRNGKTDKLHEEFPEEVQPLVNELNNLIDHNAVLLKRARNRLGDLAHSIKNPLTVINNEACNLESGQRELILDQTSDIANSVNRYLSRARASGSDNVLGARANIKSVAEDLAFAMKRIHNIRDLDIDFTGLGSYSFRGEAQDLEEILGNLMDNACKWANSRVVVRCEGLEGRCHLVVEDDGPGIPEEELESVLQRGRRLDETTPGHGLGLNIVQQMLEIYGGKLTFSRSAYGGLKAELDLPGA